MPRAGAIAELPVHHMSRGLSQPSASLLNDVKHSMSWLPYEVVKLFQPHVAAKCATMLMTIRRCEAATVRRGVRRERAAKRGGGHLARGEGAHHVRPCT